MSDCFYSEGGIFCLCFHSLRGFGRCQTASMARDANLALFLEFLLGNVSFVSVLFGVFVFGVKVGCSCLETTLACS